MILAFLLFFKDTVDTVSFDIRKIPDDLDFIQAELQKFEPQFRLPSWPADKAEQLRDNHWGFFYQLLAKERRLRQQLHNTREPIDVSFLFQSLTSNDNHHPSGSNAPDTTATDTCPANCSSSNLCSGISPDNSPCDQSAINQPFTDSTSSLDTRTSVQHSDSNQSVSPPEASLPSDLADPNSPFYHFAKYQKHLLHRYGQPSPLANPPLSIEIPPEERPSPEGAPSEPLLQTLPPPGSSLPVRPRRRPLTLYIPPRPNFQDRTLASVHHSTELLHQHSQAQQAPHQASSTPPGFQAIRQTSILADVQHRKALLLHHGLQTQHPSSPPFQHSLQLEGLQRPDRPSAPRPTVSVLPLPPNPAATDTNTTSNSFNFSDSDNGDSDGNVERSVTYINPSDPPPEEPAEDDTSDDIGGIYVRASERYTPRPIFKRDPNACCKNTFIHILTPKCCTPQKLPCVQTHYGQELTHLQPPRDHLANRQSILYNHYLNRSCYAYTVALRDYNTYKLQLQERGAVVIPPRLTDYSPLGIRELSYPYDPYLTLGPDPASTPDSDTIHNEYNIRFRNNIDITSAPAPAPVTPPETVSIDTSGNCHNCNNNVNHFRELFRKLKSTHLPAVRLFLARNFDSVIVALTAIIVAIYFLI